MKEIESFRFQIKPELPKKSDYNTIFEEAKDYSEDYQKVYCLIDMDNIVGCNQFNKYDLIKIKLMKEFKNINIIENYPCLETWFAFHFEDFGKLFTNYDELIKEKLIKKDRLGDYKKGDNSGKYYLKLKPFQEEAIKRAKRSCEKRITELENGVNQIEECKLPFSEMYQIINDLLN